ncbi:MAG: sigma-E processing peptidase SpoIIGA [Thermaerobacter sp.]|nr:sigma-E processing peptidase SpoIIGA [Thermaerobacter sp.]
MPNLDQYLAVNLLMDALLLGALARVRLQRLDWRVAVGATAGAVYATLAVLPGWAALTGPVGEILAAVVMVRIARRVKGLRQTLVETGVLLLLAAGLAGLALLVSAIVRPTGVVGDAASLAAAAALFVLAAEAYARRQRTARTAGTVLPVEIAWFGRRLLVQAFVDSGCQVRDPSTGLPVVIAELRALRALLPPRLWSALQQPALGAAQEVAAAAADDDRVASSLRLVQLSTVTSEGEWLFGLRAQARVGGGPVQMAVVCVTPRRLSQGGSFAALVPPQMCAIGEGVVS